MRLVITECDHDSFAAEHEVADPAGAELVLTQSRSAEELVANAAGAAAILVQYATITAELQALSEERQRLLPLKDLREQITGLVQEQTRRRLALHELEEALVPSAGFLLQLRDVLRSIFDHIKLPHFTGRVRIDPDTFLPIIDSLDFDERGGAGRSAVSFAYSLALLVIALRALWSGGRML